MKCNYVLIKQTENGQLVYLKNQKQYQLTYKNLNFSLSDIELNTLYSYLKKIDAAYWEKEYENSIYDRKIPIPTTQKNFIILLNEFELIELQFILSNALEKISNRCFIVKLPIFWN
jgi:hypothetical protein